MSETQTGGRKGLLKILASEVLLGALVATLTVMTALTAYQGSLADSKESDENVAGQKVLSESNTEFLRANQAIIYDYQMYDGYYINQENADLLDYYQTSFSEDLQASMERAEGPFDDPYYEAIYADADASYEEAMTHFDAAQAAGDKADKYQGIVLFFAVGLTLAAWASMLKDEAILRPVFALISLVALIYGVANFIMLLVSA